MKVIIALLVVSITCLVTLVDSLSDLNKIVN